MGYGAVVQGTIFTGEGALDSAGLAAIRLDSFAHGSRIVSGVTPSSPEVTPLSSQKVQTLTIYADNQPERSEDTTVSADSIGWHPTCATRRVAD